MRIIVFFDLPTETGKDKSNYIRFRKLLIKNGFIMMQKSVYCKLLPNMSAVKTTLDLIRKNKPAKGLVEALTITEKQFSDIEIIAGDFMTDIINTDEKIVVL